MISQTEGAVETLRFFENGCKAAAYGKCAIDSETCPVTMLERYSDEIADGHGSF